MKKQMKELIDQYDKGGFTYDELEWELLNLFSVTQRSELLNDFFWKYLHTQKTNNDKVEPHNIVDDYLKGVLL